MPISTNTRTEKASLAVSHKNTLPSSPLRGHLLLPRSWLSHPAAHRVCGFRDFLPNARTAICGKRYLAGTGWNMFVWMFASGWVFAAAPGSVCVCSWWVGVCVEWKNGGNDDTNRAGWWEAGVRALLLLAGWMQYLTADWESAGTLFTPSHQKVSASSAVVSG